MHALIAPLFLMRDAICLVSKSAIQTIFLSIKKLEKSFVDLQLEGFVGISLKTKPLT